jgi:hypothetical protein
MSHNRLRVFLKSRLLFAILVGPSAAAQPSPTRNDSIVVFAPHPDTRWTRLGQNDALLSDRYSPLCGVLPTTRPAIRIYRSILDL